MANMRDVAEQAGVSIAAVSRILSHDADYNASELTRDKVFETAARLGYTVKESYRSKKPEKHKNSVCCIINVTNEKHDDSYYTAILEGLKLELSKRNYTVDYIKSQYEIIDPEDLRRVLKQSKGLVLMTTPPKEVFDIIQEEKTKVVGIDTSLDEIDNIRYNRFEAGCKAMQHLIENGHKKIAFIGSYIPDKNSLSFGRFDAYRTMMKRYDLPVNGNWIIDCRWQRQLCYDCTEELIRQKDKPTAIFFASDYMAIASLSAIYNNGLSVPGDFSIIGISNIDESQYLNPPLTTIDIPQREIGKIAAATLLSRINSDTTPPKQIYVPTSLIIRKSVKPM